MAEDGTVAFNSQGMPLSPVVRQTEVVDDRGNELSLIGMRPDRSNGTPVRCIDLHKLYVWRSLCHTATLPANCLIALFHDDTVYVEPFAVVTQPAFGIDEIRQRLRQGRRSSCQTWN